MSEIAGQPGLRGAATAVVHESYSFACMRCGHGWEQSYEIEHHKDAEDHEFVLYVVGGRIVPSPLSKPTCQNCDGHSVRIMRAGQVSSARNAELQQHHRTPPARHAEVPKKQTPAKGTAAAEAAKTPEATGASRAAEPERQEHHWHLSDLWHPFHHKAG
ncbi:hypothetical protein LXH13_23935 [Streptomyces spinosirectus]|uniref:hypothetical protein n=1 Tax=Streptomyces TaxID=1883 RepID=UPI000D387CD4|nr:MULTISPECIES: hypothetical protein [Streptomyces]MBY8345463.1 hypothetical protein [Streptomyces plumbidurans]PTM97930.1 hypothetical protein C7821_103141 [Streptomyces sp. VMFN-G11Ma]UIR19905.1 hypothetical protein LXH13_23935 [Streptomyces spinosirectus]